MSIIIDASHVFHRNLNMNKKDIVEYERNEKGIAVATGEINEGYLVHLLFTSILLMAKKFKASEKNRVILALDSKPSWRNDYYLKHSKNFPEYKGETYKGGRKKHDDIPFDKIMAAFDLAMETLKQCTDFIVLKADLCEADDIIGILAMAEKEEDVYVCSGDKDFHQLQTANVHLYDPIKKIIKPPMDIERDSQLHYLVAGDDNIKHVRKGMGPKTAEKALKEGLDLLLQTNIDIKERYEFNKKLMSFEELPEEIVQGIKKVIDNNKDFCYNGTKLMTFFGKYRMKKMLPRINEFKLKGKQFEKVNIRPNVSRTKTVVETSIEDFFS